MNRISKILSLVLLLAALVSAFGIFAAFAEDATTPASDMVVIDDFEKYTPSWQGSSLYTSKSHTYGQYYTAVQVDDEGNVILNEDGTPAQLFKYAKATGYKYGAKAVKMTADNGEEFYRIGYQDFPSDIKVKYLSTPYINGKNKDNGGAGALLTVENDYYNEGDTAASAEPVLEDNADFVIFDMDISASALQNLTFALQHQFFGRVLNKNGVAAATSCQNGRLLFKKTDTTDAFEIYYEDAKDVLHQIGRASCRERVCLSV